MAELRYRAYISYSHKDEMWKDRLRPHLAVLERQGRVSIWDDRQIDAGVQWHPAILDVMGRCRVAICLISADYLDSKGDLIKKYIIEPMKIGKFATIRFIIKSSDKKGGSGAKFIVRWVSNEPVNTPLIEAIMINTRGGQGVSFISRGREIKE